MKKLSLLFIVAFMLLSCAWEAPALVSLDPEHQEVIPLTDKFGQAENYTFLRDATNELTWYYVPNKPRLAEVTTADKKAKPVFQMMTFQTDDSDGIGGGAILQFSLQMDMEPAMASQAKNFMIKELKIASDPKALKVIPLPVASASIQLYKPDGKWVSEAPQMPGVAPSFATQQMPFQLSLTELGADAYKSLTTEGQGGLGVLYTCYFEGVTPSSNFKITVDWDQTYKHISSSEKKKTEWSCLFWGGSDESSVASAADDLINNSCIIIDATIKNGDKMVEQQMDAIIKRINDGMVENLKAPEACAPADAKAIEGSAFMGMFGGSKTSTAFKNVEKRKKGKEVIVFNKKEIVTRPTSCGTYIGIGKYPKEIKDECFFRMKKGNWEKAYFTLPTVTESDELNIVSVILNCCLVDKAKNQIKGVPNKSAKWERSKVAEVDPYWFDPKDSKKTPINVIPFACGDIFEPAQKAGKNVGEEFFYKTDVQITLKNATVLNVTRYAPLANGDFPVNPPLDVAQALIFDASELTFGDKTEKESLKEVGIAITAKNPSKKQTATLKGEKNTAVMILEAETADIKNPVSAQVTFKLHGGKQVKWAQNGQNLWDVDETMRFSFDDEDFMPSGD
ncbi:MAG: hypothetical protein HQM10_11795 [Candidatus Riflebacteria bacterium]|nr:hypothetical protein [Candidatus Riflebacteria bacterium]